MPGTQSIYEGFDLRGSLLVGEVTDDSSELIFGELWITIGIEGVSVTPLAHQEVVTSLFESPDSQQATQLLVGIFA